MEEDSEDATGNAEQTTGTTQTPREEIEMDELEVAGVEDNEGSSAASDQPVQKKPRRPSKRKRITANNEMIGGHGKFRRASPQFLF